MPAIPLAAFLPGLSFSRSGAPRVWKICDQSVYCGLSTVDYSLHRSQ